MPAAKLKQFLDANRVPYASIKHYEAFTAQEIAAAAHVRGRELAKTVMAKIDGTMAMAVLPAPKKLDVESLKDVARATTVELATEREFKDLFGDCEPGAMPPFGNLYGLKVYVDASLADDEHIAFNAGTHDELIQMPYRDFQRLVQPVIAELTYRHPQPA